MLLISQGGGDDGREGRKVQRIVQRLFVDSLAQTAPMNSKHERHPSARAEVKAKSITKRELVNAKREEARLKQGSCLGADPSCLLPPWKVTAAGAKQLRERGKEFLGSPSLYHEEYRDEFRPRKTRQPPSRSLAILWSGMSYSWHFQQTIAELITPAVHQGWEIDTYVTMQWGNASLRFGGRRKAPRSAAVPFRARADAFERACLGLEGKGRCTVQLLREIKPLPLAPLRHLSLFRPNATWLKELMVPQSTYDDFMIALLRQFHGNWLNARAMLLNERQPYFALRLREDAGWYAPIDLDLLLSYERDRRRGALPSPHDPEASEILRGSQEEAREMPFGLDAAGEAPILFRPCMHMRGQPSHQPHRNVLPGLSDKVWLGPRRLVAWLSEAMWLSLFLMPPAPPHFHAEEQHILVLLARHGVPFDQPSPQWDASGRMTSFGIPVSDAIELTGGRGVCFRRGYIAADCRRPKDVRLCNNRHFGDEDGDYSPPPPPWSRRPGGRSRSWVKPKRTAAAAG